MTDAEVLHALAKNLALVGAPQALVDAAFQRAALQEATTDG